MSESASRTVTTTFDGAIRSPAHSRVSSRPPAVALLAFPGHSAAPSVCVDEVKA